LSRSKAPSGGETTVYAPHDLRHTAVALWIAAGAPPREIGNLIAQRFELLVKLKAFAIGQRGVLVGAILDAPLAR